MSGKPYLKLLCKVLWWKKYIPTMAPAAPPKIEVIKSSFSGMRQFPFCAKRLSIPNNANASTLIIMMYFMTFAPPFRKPGSSLYAAATARIISLYVDIGEVDTS